MLIDFHAHVFPDEIAHRAMPGLAAAWGEGVPYHDGTLSGLRAYQKREGVDLSVIQPIATNPHKPPTTLNDFSATLIDKSGGTLASSLTGCEGSGKLASAGSPGSSGTLVAFGSVHPHYSGWREELTRIRDLGLLGIKLHPDYQGVFVDDPACVAVMRACGELGLPVLLHAGLDTGFPDTHHCTPARMASILPELPETVVILAHLGGVRYLDDVLGLLAPRHSPRLYLDTSYTLTHEPLELCERVLRAWNPELLLFGSDAPWGSASGDVETLLSMKFDAGWYDAVFSGNAKRLLRL